MPPSAVKTVRDLIYWQYAKIVSHSAGAGKKKYGFIMDRFKKLQSGDMEWSGSIREYIKERETPNECIYCGSTEKPSWDHLIPVSRGGPNIPDNMVMACQSCNSSKGSKGVYEWRGLKEKDNVHRIAEGKYLKLLYQLHEEGGTLDAGRNDIERLCDPCDIGYLCEEAALTVYCLESILVKGNKQG